MSSLLDFEPYDPTDETADHLRGSGGVISINRAEARRDAKKRVVGQLQRHGGDQSTASPALVADARRHYGSWDRACLAAGVLNPKEAA